MFRFKLPSLNIVRYKSSLLKQIQKFKIVPDVIDTVPNRTVKIVYGDHVMVTPGCTLTPRQVKIEPLFVWECDPKKFHTIAMVDPDVPCRQNPIFREWQHMIVGNIRGCNMGTGKKIVDYIGAGPPKDTGLHRYVFLIYKQKAEIKFEEAYLSRYAGKARGKFSIRSFAKKYELGQPIACNFYQAEYDDSVPYLHKQIGLA